EATVSRLTAKALALNVGLLSQTLLLRQSDRETRLAQLEREKVELESARVVAKARIDELRHAIKLRTICAPVCGQVAHVVPVTVGSGTRPGEKLAAITPDEQPRVVAQFPAAAVGRTHPGQFARFRVEGFPWTQYGPLAATVARVGNEPA